MPVRLGYSIAGCSGEDPEFPATALLEHSSDSRGWCTPRFSQYPQELTLRLDAPARLQQIQLLSHEFKIAARMELLVGVLEAPGGGGGGQALAPAPPGADPAKATWRRLGFLSFDSNEGSGFTARELKSVALADVPAHLVRLAFHRCHPNAANIYGQVSLVALSLMGEPLAPSPLSPITNMAPPAAQPSPPFGLAPPVAAAYMQPAAMQAQPPVYVQPPMQPMPAAAATVPAPSPAEALAAELGVDSVTAQRIHELQLQKQQAVEREDYDEAKRLKGAVDRLRAAGSAIAGLEARKRVAVQEEDYDLAKQLKLEVDRMRAAAYASALSGAAAESAFSPAQSRRGSVAGVGAAAAARPSGDGGLPGELSAAGHSGRAAADGGEYSSPPPAVRRPAPPAASASGGDWGSHDERPAQAKGAYDFHNADESSTPVNTRRRSVQAGPAPRTAATASDAGPAPPGFPADLPPPDALSAADAKDAAPLADLVGEYLARCLYSKAWQLREAALQRVAADLEAGRLEGLESGGADAAKTLARALQRACRDKVAAVFSASLAALRVLAAAAAAGRCAPRDLQAALADLLPLLVEKAADLNQRTREQATEALVGLAGAPQAGLKGSTAPFLRPPKAGAAPKVVLGRLQLVSALLPVLGVASRGGGEGFPLEPLMEFVGPTLSHSSAEVRGAGVALVLQAAGAAGPAVQRLLPPGLNAKVREQIEAGLLNPTAALAASAGAKPSPRAAAAAAAAPAQAKPPARKQQAAAAAAPAPPAASAAPSLSPQQAAQQQAAQQQAQQAQQGPAPAPPGAGGPEDDPAAYEAEVQARQARLGPGHPDVAEAICNLAILYNQRGDIAQALPLYERALAIWEAACGPDSPDVAHTLTDIAVIHLEQGRDDVGRPLLQRALAIQEALLGPDHPDVLAIRDVLEEDA